MTSHRIGDAQILLLMLKVDQPRFKHSLACLDRLFPPRQQAISAVRCPKILNVIGKYDLALPLEGESLAVLSRAAYNVISFLERQLPGTVVDFLKIPGFRWGGVPSVKSPPHSVALVQIKLKNPL